MIQTPPGKTGALPHGKCVYAEEQPGKREEVFKVSACPQNTPEPNLIELHGTYFEYHGGADWVWLAGYQNTPLTQESATFTLFSSGFVTDCTAHGQKCHPSSFL